MRRIGFSIFAPTLSLLLVIGICASSVGCSGRQNAAPRLNTEYQAVLLTNGQVFFGRLEGLGNTYPVLREVYYVRAVPSPVDSTKTTNVLVRRGQEWHAPDIMVLNADHIVLVEPVTKDSKVAQLIAEQKQK
jgi:hypothetical protein